MHVLKILLSSDNLFLEKNVYETIEVSLKHLPLSLPSIIYSKRDETRHDFRAACIALDAYAQGNPFNRVFTSTMLR